ncbi:MAG: nicotinate phosphoribosyltransferase, partial [Candidatus Lokiarchaeota archaeon]|nr:nicotinate phosphoribosyltransferase [Candidatus Lokiarchaeota archaeon]
TDFYQLTMGAAYYQYNLENNRDENEDIAVFELFIRKYPKNRNYLIFAGLEQVIHYLLNARFSEETINFLKSKEVFKNIDPKFFDEYLPNFKFDLDVWSIPEGQFFFPNEPIMRIEGPTIQAQLAETYILNVITYQTVVASKASRIRNVSGNRIILDFGTRRSHSPLAGVYAARASYIAGFNGTSNCVADLELGIKASGTMAHSWVQRFPTELESFKAFYKIYGKNSILLIDTYDVKKGTLNACKTAKDIKGVRIDSGNLVENSKIVRKILDENDLENAIITLSSDLNEHKIKDLIEKGAPADAFGVGTEMVTSRDDPVVNSVYKLIQHNGIPKIKISEGKITYPGKKQVYRIYDENGKFLKDILMLENETPPEKSEPFLVPIMKKGELIYDFPSLDEIQQFYLKNIKKLPEEYKKLEQLNVFRLELSNGIKKLTQKLKNQ